VPIKSSSGSILDPGAPIRLFPSRIIAPFAVQLARPQYAVARDGRFLISQAAEASTTTPITIILNWRHEHVGK
jgi:hypothetical protein